MPFKSICLIAIAAVVSCCSSVNPPISDSSSEAMKQEAIEGWKGIVKEYFAQDCNRYQAMFTERIKIVNPYLDTVVATRPLFEAESMCDRIGLWTGGLMSVEDYLNRYDVVAYSMREVMDSTLRMTPRDYHVRKYSINSTFYFKLLQDRPGGLTDNDYLVFGDVSKDSNNIGGLGSPYTPVIRKTESGWKIFGMLP